MGDQTRAAGQLRSAGREPTEHQRHKAGLLAADYALGQDDPAGVLADLLDHLGLREGVTSA